MKISKAKFTFSPKGSFHNFLFVTTKTIEAIYHGREIPADSFVSNELANALNAEFGAGTCVLKDVVGFIPCEGYDFSPYQ